MRVKRYKNGGKNGDPKKDLYQDSSGFSLYRETLPDGTKIITPTPSSSNYVKLSDKVAKGYYPGIVTGKPTRILI